MWNNLYSGFINGLGMGSIYALIAIGYTMVYGIARMINFAHGEFITIGAFVSYGTAALIGANPITMVICIIVSMLVCAIVSVITEKLAYYPLRKRNTKKNNSSHNSNWGELYYIFYFSNSFINNSIH